MKDLFFEFWYLVSEMAPYLLFGFLFAGILNSWFSKNYISKHLGDNSFASVVKASLFGIPIPLCSCGVIPAGVGLYKSGASKGATTSFLISTPQTGVDSIMVTWSMLGLPFAIIRPIVALITGVGGGELSRIINKEKRKHKFDEIKYENEKANTKSLKDKILGSLKYGFYTLPADLAKWMIIGLVLAALISYFVPDDFFNYLSDKPALEMLFMLLISLPLYVCATGSVPMAAVFLFNGISPGAVLVFLMAGPATNIATISVISNSLGRKTLIAYMSSIISGAILFGILINLIFSNQFFQLNGLMESHSHHDINIWFQISAAVLLIILVFSFISVNYINCNNTLNVYNMEIKVKGMNCQHCKKSVENALLSQENISEVDVDLKSGNVKIVGDNLDKKVIGELIKSAGYQLEE